MSTRIRAKLRALLKSLRFQLLAGLLIPLGAIVVLNLSIAYRNAEVTAGLFNDRLLVASAHSIAEQLRADERGRIEALVPPSALGMFESGYGDLVYYRVSGPTGALVAGYPDLPGPKASLHDLQPSFFDTIFRAEPIHAVALMQLVPAAPRTLEAFVIVGATLKARDAMVRDLFVQAAWQQVLLVFIASALAWWGLQRDLAPLLRFSREVTLRKPNDFDPFAATYVQSELQPLVAALNEYMGRFRLQLDAQRRFAANAAHQLRTPLTLLRTQAQFALREMNGAKSSDAVGAILATTKQMTHLTNQLLSLSKVEARGRGGKREPIDLVELIGSVLEEHGGAAAQREIDLAFEVARNEPVVTLGHATMLRELVINLVDNALRYTPRGGAVVVSLAREADACLLKVQDNGPGIAVSERDLVFERFHRVIGNDAEGSGLGLAIVKEIVDASAGTIALHDPDAGPGLVVEVRLPWAE